MGKIDYKKEQIHAGKRQNKTNIKGLGDGLWHTDSEGKYWCGNWYYRTPKQLLEECRSTIADLLVNHPELK